MTKHPAAGRIPPVATILAPAERTHVDVAGAGLYRALHRNSPEEVLRDLRERRISAVLLSVARCVRGEAPRMAMVVREFPHVPAVAILADSGGSAEAVLALGNCGVTTIVDVRAPAGWRRLRELLGREATLEMDRHALVLLRGDLDGVAQECWRFFELLFHPAYNAATVRQLSGYLGVVPSTLVSRFYRANLPAPKRYLAYARLVRAARLLENPGLSIADIANHLNYSSPQSLGRHIRTLLRVTAGEFRGAYDGAAMLARFRAELVAPHIETLRSFRPLAMRPGGRPPVRPRPGRAMPLNA